MGGVKIYGLGLVKRNKVMERGYKSNYLCTIWIFKHWKENISNILH